VRLIPCRHLSAADAVAGTRARAAPGDDSFSRPFSRRGTSGRVRRRANRCGRPG
jgi:hypothetical protein